MDLIDKYLGEARMPYGKSPSLDSLKYDPSETEDIKKFGEDMVKLAKSFLPVGMARDIAANIGWAIKKGDKKKVKKLIDIYGDLIIGGQSTVNMLTKWINSK